MAKLKRMKASEWIARLDAWRNRAEEARAPLLASRDLPPVDPVTQLTLPRSPEPMPDDALLFARDAARRTMDARLDAANGDDPTRTTARPIVTGADLRALLERFERNRARLEALDQAAQARGRLVQQLAAGRTGSHLRLVGQSHARADRTHRQSDSGSDLGLDLSVEEALTSALAKLKHISMLARG